MKRIFIAYQELFSILFSQAPFLVIVTFVSAVLSGVTTPLLIWVNSRIFDLGLLTASGEIAFSSYIPYLILFVLLSLLPVLVGDLLSSSYIRPRCQLIFRTAYKGKMLQKLKTLRYEHLESPSSMEIIDKTYSRTENVLLTLFPTTVQQIISAGIAGLEDKDRESLLGKDVGGVDLSGGEWQKLSIARNVYRDRDFIVLDEPTSNLDPLAETEIFRKYLELSGDKTVIYVTHRISAASLADRIIVFENGRIVQDGTHEELLASGGTYGRLYREQAKWYDR